MKNEIFYNLDCFADMHDPKKITPNNKVVAVTVVDNERKEWKSWSVPVEDFNSDNMIDATYHSVADPEVVAREYDQKGYKHTELDIWKK